MTSAKRSKAGLWWGLGAAILVLAIGATAAIVVPLWLHTKRVEAYTVEVQHIQNSFAQIDATELETKLVTVLYGLQLPEAHKLQERMFELGNASDEYFSADNKAAFKAADARLEEYLVEDGLNDSEQELIASATKLIQVEGYKWQTEFLNLNIQAIEQLVEVPAPRTFAVSPDEDVTEEVLAAAKEARDQADAQLDTAKAHLAEVKQRANAFIEAVTATLEPLAIAAKQTPEQAETVRITYANADKGVIEYMLEVAAIAAASVDAKLFTINDDYVSVPVIGDAPSDRPFYEVSDSWRATIISTHLVDYGNAAGAAWITDAGGIEEAFGFNPFLPFF